MGAQTWACLAMVGNVIFLCTGGLAAVKLQLGGTLDVSKLAFVGCVDTVDEEIAPLCLFLDPNVILRGQIAPTNEEFAAETLLEVARFKATLAFFPSVQRQGMMLGSMMSMLSILMSPVLCCVSTFFTWLLWALSLTVVAISVVQANATLHQQMVAALAIAWAIVIGLCLPWGPAAQQKAERTHLLAAQQLPRRPHTLAHRHTLDLQDVLRHPHELARHHTFDMQDAWEEEVEKAAAAMAAGQPQQANRHLTPSLRAPADQQRNTDQPRSRNRRVHTPPPRKRAVIEKGVPMTLREQTQSECDLHLQTALKYE